MATAAPTTALLAGATGLVGGLCLDRLLGDGAFTKVVVVARRPLERTRPGLALVTCADFSRLDEQPPVERAAGDAPAAALCALGTTIKRAGSQAAFHAVDHDAVVAFARWARRSGADTFVLCSAVGASAASNNFYLRTKGEVEASVAAVGFRRLVIVRPALLLGTRPETRPVEALARVMMPALAPLLAGPLRRYRGIRADRVAAAMVAAARSAPEGRHLWEHDDIRRNAGHAS